MPAEKNAFLPPPQLNFYILDIKVPRSYASRHFVRYFAIPSNELIRLNHHHGHAILTDHVKGDLMFRH